MCLRLQQLFSDYKQIVYNSLKTKPIIKNLVLDGLDRFDKDAKLALTLSFAAEFYFGGYDDIRQNPPIHYYLMKIFSHSILYNPSARTIVSSVPVRATIGGAIDIASKKEGWKSEVMTKSFYNDQNPEMRTGNCNSSEPYERSEGRVSVQSIGDYVSCT